LPSAAVRSLGIGAAVPNGFQDGPKTPCFKEFLREILNKKLALQRFEGAREKQRISAASERNFAPL
jgi:hypothetical protein